MKIHEERDELLVKVEQLTAEKRELERQLDELRLRGAGVGQDGARASGDAETVALLRKEQEVLRQEYEAELE